MFLSLAELYVQSINSGGVPDMGSAWSNICKNTCSKAIHEAQESLKLQLNKIALPLAEQSLLERFTDP